ncbi:DinB family protein [Chloroflexota bacterium]
MLWQQIIINIFDRMSQEIERSLNGLNLGDVNQQPSPDTNSIGWLTWHLTRCFDESIANLLGKEQLWIKDKWHIKFNRSADPRDLGARHSPEDLAAFKPPETQILLDYHRAVLELAKYYIANLSETDLDRKLDHPRFPTVAARLVGVINDNYQHVGQIAYVRGLFKGIGWWEAVRS